MSSEGYINISNSLSHNTVLTSLDISDSCIGEGGAKAISAALKINTTLKQLHLERCAIGAQGFMAMAKALEVDSTLTTLFLGSNKKKLRCDGSGDVRGKAIGDALARNTVLKLLDLEDCRMFSESGLAIFKALQTNSTLEVLKMSKNTIGDGAGRAIGDGLARNIE